MNKEIQTYIEELLKHLSELIINEGKARHNITINDKGQLTVSIIYGGLWHEVFFDNNYIDISAFDLAKNISKYFIK